MEVSQNNAVRRGEADELSEEPRRSVILVVDDEEQIRTVLRLILTRAGYEVREAEDGEIGLRRIQNDPPDLILLDVLMPGMDGFTVCRQVRAGSHTAHIPIFMLSAKTDPRSREEGIRAGASSYLTKPINFEQLLQNVAEALDVGAE
jgi:DNA-binding response OmpR family regulator